MSVLRRTRVSGTPRGFKELQFTTGEVTLNYVVGPDHGLPLLLMPGQMESWQGYKKESKEQLPPNTPLTPLYDLKIVRILEVDFGPIAIRCDAANAQHVGRFGIV